MPVNVAQRLLHDAEKRRFQFRRKTRKILRNLHDHGSAVALGEAVGQPAQGKDQPGFLEERRMEQIGNGAQFVDHLAADFARLGSESLRLGRIAGLFQRAHVDLQGGETLRRGVVKFAGQATTLLVLRSNEARGETRELSLRILQLALRRHLLGHIGGDPLGLAATA